MARPFVLPDLGEGLTEAEIVKVLVHEGDVIREDAPLLEVETDKAHVEIPSPMGGRVETIHVRPGQTVRVGEVLVTFTEAGSAGDGGAGTAALLDTPFAGGRSRSPVSSEPASASGATTSSTPSRPAPAPPSGETVAATPATRRLARELGVDLHAVRGRGRGGRVTDDDVRAAAETPSRAVAAEGRAGPERRVERESAVAKPLAPIGVEPPPLPKFEQWGPVERQPLSHLRRTIADR